MNKITRRIISGAVVIVCAVSGLSAVSHITAGKNPGSLPVSMMMYEDEKPVIILDAGHGEPT